LSSPFRIAFALVVSISLAGAVEATHVAADSSGRVSGRAKPFPTVAWKPCGIGGECAKLTVPLDYNHPDNGKTIKVALFRVRASDFQRRIGSLLMNFGGPGAPGVEPLRQLAGELPDELRARFDVVGFDPRGTGDTLPVKCEDNLDGVFHLDYSPDTPAERGQLNSGLQQLAQSCAQRSGEVLPYVSSESTVRDMDRIRGAVGDKKLTYVGYSYGTYLGTRYAKLFPKKVRALVLDGAVDPSLSRFELLLDQAKGFEHNLDGFFDRCSQDRRCAFYNGADPRGAFDQLAGQIDETPIPAGEGRTLGPGEFGYGVVQPLYSGSDSDGDLAQALRAAQRGDGEPLLALSDQYTGRRSDGSYDSSQPAYWAIGCLDGPSGGGPDAYQAAEPQFQAAAPRTGVSNLNDTLVCAYWPVPPIEQRTPIRVNGTAPILVIGTTDDPATPLKWAHALTKDLSSGVLLVAEGTQHTSFLFAFNRCVDTKTVKYLVDLTPPRDGQMCD
jgi:pimeloyl-ACP methyl ester carboxylesterase